MALLYGLRRGYKAIRAVEKIFAIVEKLPDEVASIKAEVKPNGGSSLRDAVNRIDRDVQAMKEHRSLCPYERGLIEATPNHP